MLHKVSGEIDTANDNQVQRLVDMSNTIFTQIHKMAANLCVDRDVNNYIYGNEGVISSATQKLLAEKLVYYKNLAKYIDSIYVYSPDKNRICATDNQCEGAEQCAGFEDYEFLNWINENMSNDTATFPRKLDGTFPKVISLVKKLTDGGYVVVNINYSIFLDNIQSAFDCPTEFFTLDDNDKIIFPDDPGKSKTTVENMIAQKTERLSEKGTNNIYSLVSIGYFEQRFIIKCDMGKYAASTKNTIKIVVFVFIGFIIVSILAAGFLSFSSLEIVVKLHDVLENKKLDVSGMRDNEGKYIISKIVGLIDENEEFKSQLEERLCEYNKAQVTALQKQINSHFLNNALSAVSYKIVEDTGPGSPALKIISKLTRIIRYGFESETMVTLGDEVKFIEDYVKVLRERFGNFGFEEDISPDLLEKKVLRLSIQPFVENAAYHGIRDIDGDGIIKLSAKESNGLLMISVENNGKCIEEAQIEEIKAAVNKGDYEKHTGIINVYKRLKLIYSDKCSFDIESDGKTFTKVTMGIPL